MKTSWGKFKCLFISLFFSGCFLFLTSGCGLDQVYYISAPTRTYNVPENTSFFSEAYFEFETNEKKDFEDFVYSGTEIYYKIYSRYNDDLASTDLTSQRSSIYSISTSDNYATAATKMIETYGFKPLYVCTPSVENPDDKKFDKTEPCIIPFTSENKRVHIRLTDYQDLDEFSARVYYTTSGSEPHYIGSEKSFPCRYSSSNSFNFGRKGIRDAKPEKDNGESDLSYTDFDSGAENTFYVALYAVVSGRDISYVTYHSNVLYLGCVPINANVEDN